VLPPSALFTVKERFLIKVMKWVNLIYEYRTTNFKANHQKSQLAMFYYIARGVHGKAWVYAAAL
jgi:hypothetical protein